jgi:hypothetical protein
MQLEEFSEVSNFDRVLISNYCCALRPGLAGFFGTEVLDGRYRLTAFFTLGLICDAEGGVCSIVY